MADNPGPLGPQAGEEAHEVVNSLDDAMMASDSDINTMRPVRRRRWTILSVLLILSSPVFFLAPRHFAHYDTVFHGGFPVTQSNWVGLTATTLSYAGLVTLITGLVLMRSRWLALALFLMLISPGLALSGSLQVDYTADLPLASSATTSATAFSWAITQAGTLQVANAPYKGIGTAMEWIAPVLFLAGLSLLVWRVARRTRWGALAVVLMCFVSPVLWLTGAAALNSDNYSPAFLRSLRPDGTALKWDALVVFLSGVGILIWREGRKLLLRRAGRPGLHSH